MLNLDMRTNVEGKLLLNQKNVSNGAKKLQALKVMR
jgi:hypothetical protein